MKHSLSVNYKVKVYYRYDDSLWYTSIKLGIGVSLDFEDGYVLAFTNDIDDLYSEHHNLEDSDVEVHFMGWTGNHDRYGVDIFEGDIVEHKYKGKIITSVVFWDNMKAGFYLARAHMFDVDKWMGGGDGWGWGYIRGEHLNAKNKTVIGNVFQNRDVIDRERS